MTQVTIKIIVDGMVKTDITRIQEVSFDTSKPAVVEHLNAMGIHAPYKAQYSLVISKK